MQKKWRMERQHENKKQYWWNISTTFKGRRQHFKSKREKKNSMRISFLFQLNTLLPTKHLYFNKQSTCTTIYVVLLHLPWREDITFFFYRSRSMKHNLNRNCIIVCNISISRLIKMKVKCHNNDHLAIQLKIATFHPASFHRLLITANFILCALSLCHTNSD